MRLSQKQIHRAAKRAGAAVRRYGSEAAFLEAMSANELAQRDGRMGDYSWKWLDWRRVEQADRCTPGRAYAKIVTARETFFVGYNRSAGHLIEQAAGTADTSATVVWKDRTYADAANDPDFSVERGRGGSSYS